MGFFHALAEHTFLQYAAIAGCMASIGCGVIGTYVVVRRITFLAGGIAHTVLAGMGAAIYFGFDPLIGALIMAIIAALLIGTIRLTWNTHEDTLIGALWAVGMATGILFISATPGYQNDLMSYLFGNILFVTQSNLWFMLALNITILAFVVLWNKQFLLVCFDPQFAKLRGVPVTFFYLLLLVLIAITVVLLIQVVGLILVLALLTLPAAIAGHYLRTLGTIMLTAMFIGVLMTFSGLVLSYELDIPTGATIIAITGVVYSLSALLSRWLSWHNTRLEFARTQQIQEQRRE